MGLFKITLLGLRDTSSVVHLTGDNKTEVIRRLPATIKQTPYHYDIDNDLYFKVLGFKVEDVTKEHTKQGEWLMTEKIEQSKQFIKEFEKAREASGTWILAGFRTVKHNAKGYPTLYKWLFEGTPDEDNDNQLTFSKIWVGEIKLVEKKAKYVIYQLDRDDEIWVLKKQYEVIITQCINETDKPKIIEYCNSETYLFERDFAFAMRDTGMFEIEEVE